MARNPVPGLAHAGGWLSQAGKPGFYADVLVDCMVGVATSKLFEMLGSANASPNLRCRTFRLIYQVIEGVTNH
jgi:hypothetical protein